MKQAEVTQFTVNEEDRNSNKKTINEILTNFKKEKESFNVKLSQLKIKLDQVKSPKNVQYR